MANCRRRFLFDGIFYSLYHGTYIRWYLINICAREEQSLLFDLFKASDSIESSHKSNFSLRKEIFSFMRAQYVMSNTIKYKYNDLYNQTLETVRFGQTKRITCVQDSFLRAKLANVTSVFWPCLLITIQNNSYISFFCVIKKCDVKNVYVLCIK